MLPVGLIGPFWSIPPGTRGHGTPAEPTFQDLHGPHWTVLLVCAPGAQGVMNWEQLPAGELEAIGILSQA